MTRMSGVVSVGVECGREFGACGVSEGVGACGLYGSCHGLTLGGPFQCCLPRIGVLLTETPNSESFWPCTLILIILATIHDSVKQHGRPLASHRDATLTTSRHFRQRSQKAKEAPAARC